MNKILVFLICLGVVYGFSKSSKPSKTFVYDNVVDTFINKTSSGSASTLLVSKGGYRADSALIMPPIIYSDTTAANFSKSASYSGSFIMTSGGSVWYRTLSPNKWNLFATGSVPSTFNPIAGYSIILSGSYPNITFTVDTTLVVSKSYFNNLGVKYSDTSGMLSNYVTTAGYGLTKGTHSLTVDTSKIIPYTDTLKDNGIATKTDIRNSPSGTVTSVTASLPLTVTNTTTTPNITIDSTNSVYGMTTLFQNSKKFNNSDSATLLRGLGVATRVPFYSTSKVLTSSSSLTWDGTNFVSSNFLTGGSYLTGGSSGGSGSLFYDNVNSLVLKSHFDTTVIQGGNDNSNFRAISFKIGNTWVSKIDENRVFYSVNSVDNSATDNRYVTASWVLNKGYTTNTGTVTSIATNTGTGITGGTIITAGTLANDTTNLSTRLWRQKGVDSLNGLISARVKYTDTATMLTPYMRKDFSNVTGTLGVSNGGTGLTSLTSQQIPFGNGTSAFGSSSGLKWDGTYLYASNFTPASSSGKYYLSGSSGGNTTFYWDEANSTNIVTQFDSLRLQAGSNNSNKRYGNLYTGNTRVSYWSDDGYLYSSPTVGLSDNTQKYATTAFVKGQGYLTTAVTSVTGTANQVLANGTTGSAQTGSVTLTLPQSIATTSDVTFNTATLGYTSAMSSSSQYGSISNLTLNSAATNSSQAYYGGLVGQLALNSSGTYTFDAKTAVGGLVGKAYIQSSGTYDKAAGVFSSGQFNNTPTITNYAGFYSLSPYLTFGGSYASGAITNYAGLYLEASDADATVGARITNKYGIYQAGANDKNLLSGQTTISTSGIPLVVNSTNSNAIKINLQDNGTLRGSFGASSGGVDVYNSSNFSVSTFGSVNGGGAFFRLPIGVNGPIIGLTRSSTAYNWYIGIASSNDRLTFYENGGTAVADINNSTGAYTALSDSTLKKNISDADSALPKLMQIPIRKYNWKSTNDFEPYGVISQELYKILPTYVSVPSNSAGKQGVSKAEMVPMLIKSIQEQQTQIENLKAKNGDLQKQLDDIKSILTKNGIK